MKPEVFALSLPCLAPSLSPRRNAQLQNANALFLDMYEIIQYLSGLKDNVDIVQKATNWPGYREDSSSLPH